MILRLFFILLAVNTLAFVARADAAEQDQIDQPAIAVVTEAGNDPFANDFDDEMVELADLGARFLKWRFTGQAEDEGDRYGSERIYADHGVAMVGDGAALNLKWHF